MGVISQPVIMRLNASQKVTAYSNTKRYVLLLTLVKYVTAWQNFGEFASLASESSELCLRFYSCRRGYEGADRCHASVP